MATLNTIANALGKSNAALVLTNPGGNNPWLFNRPSSQGAVVPAVLLVPSTAAQAAQSSDQFYGNTEPQEEVFVDGKPFVIRIAGTVNPSQVSQSLRLYLFLGNGESSLSAGSVADVQLIIATGTLPASPAASNWLIEAKCMWDSLSNTLNVQSSGFINGTAVTSAMTQALNVAPGQVEFVVGANLASTSTVSTVTLTNFAADIL